MAESSLSAKSTFLQNKLRKFSLPFKKNMLWNKVISKCWWFQNDKTPAQIENALNKSLLCLQQLLWKSWIWSFSSCTANKHHSLAPLKPKTVPSSMAENSGEILSVYLSDGSVLNPWSGEPLLWCQNIHISLGGEGRPALCLHQTTNTFFCSMFSLMFSEQMKPWAQPGCIHKASQHWD